MSVLRNLEQLNIAHSKAIGSTQEVDEVVPKLVFKRYLSRLYEVGWGIV